MENLENIVHKLTAQDVYDDYINQPSTKDTFTMFYFRKHSDGESVELKGHKFESKDETYCISLIESIMSTEDYLGWPLSKITPNNKK